MGIFKTISISNFRNYDTLNLELMPGINVLIGENGQGKTSLLEAIYFLSVLRSFRCQQIRNLFKWGQNNFSIKGIVEDNNLLTTLEVNYGETRKLLVNGTNVYRTSELLGHAPCTAFVPEDIKLIRGTGVERRRFLDTSLSVLYPHYLSLIQDYHKALKSRNLLLKCKSPDIKLIESFDTILVRTGAHITLYRTRFCETLAEHMKALSKEMFSKAQELKISYDYSYSSGNHAQTLNEFEQALAHAIYKNRPKDIDYQLTHIGPHREKFSLFLDQKLLQDYGSDGQCRLAVLILKMATAEFFLRERRGEAIVFLVDDVTGELDKGHQNLFLKLLGRAGQVFFACTDENMLARINSSVVFDIHNGAANIRSR